MLLPALQFGNEHGKDMPSIDETAALAGAWHAGQVDKSGQPYVGHLIRVSRHLLRLFPDATVAERQAAWLHDSIEDTEATAGDLRQMGYSEEVIAIVQAVTISDTGLSYADRIEALATGGNLSAIRVKLADLSDNSDRTRLAELPPERAASMGARYRAAISRLTDVLEKGG